MQIWLASFNTNAIFINTVIFNNSLLWYTVTFFTYIISFKLYNNLIRCLLLYPSFMEEDTETLSG